jgi:hypothetical protein
MSTIVAVLHDAQHIVFVSPGSLKEGCFLPHTHFLFLISTIVEVLHDAQHIALVSPGSLKEGRALLHIHINEASFLFSL